MKAIVISAFPACGKSTYFNQKSIYSKTGLSEKEGGLKILDSDSSFFSWTYEENGVKTDTRNPEFPQNYIEHIKKHLDTEDIIFVSSHKVVREALDAAGIRYYSVFPDKDSKDEWIRRFKERGNDDSFIKFQDEHYDEFIDDLMNDTTPLLKCILNKNNVIDDRLIVMLRTGSRSDVCL